MNAPVRTPVYRPRLLNGEMVRAVLSGRKTQTRQPATDNRPWKPFGEPGDRLWVRETWRPTIVHHCAEDACDCADVELRYQATDQDQQCEPRFVSDYDISGDWTLPAAARTGWVPSIHMPRWASRITLVVKQAWSERLQDILEVDALAEGVFTDTWGTPGDQMPGTELGSARDAFAALWDSIYAARGLGWQDNPHVWCCEFEVEEVRG